MNYNNWCGKMFLKDLWYDLTNKKFIVESPKTLPPLENLKVTEWCEEFENGCRSRMIMGAFRYGVLKEKAYLKYNLLREIKRRIALYEEDKNLEHLFDCANMCMLQYLKGKENNEIINSIDDGEHAKLED